MELKFNVTGSERKALVEAISEITGEKAKKKGLGIIRKKPDIKYLRKPQAEREREERNENI